MFAQNDDAVPDDSLSNTRSIQMGDIARDDLMPPRHHGTDSSDDHGDATHISGIHQVNTPHEPTQAHAPTHTSVAPVEVSHADRLRTIEHDLSDARSQLQQALTEFQTAQDRVKTLEETVTRLKGDALHALEAYKRSLIDDTSSTG